MAKYQNISEEELKVRVASEYFTKFDYRILGKIDFCISKKIKGKDIFQNLIWAESKNFPLSKANFLKAFVQLVLTIGKAKTFTVHLPPKFLCVFDSEKIGFIEYNKFLAIFSQNDFNWNVAPSNYESKEFKQLQVLCDEVLQSEKIVFNFEKNGAELKAFIKSNIENENAFDGIEIDKNNFIQIYQKWENKVRPFINVDWALFKKSGIISADFFLADLMSDKNLSLYENLYVVLQSNIYVLKKKDIDLGLLSKFDITFDQNRHKEFWSLYKRPPKNVYHEYILQRRDLLVPQDVRERKGSFFTPQIWVEKAHEYLATVLGENWQDEFYVWDCCAGTGNLLTGLVNKNNIFASTLDQADVDIMKQRVQNGWNFFENHIFQFNFLNDGFDCGKMPDMLLQIINHPQKRKRLVVLINPPYAEAGDMKQTTGTGKNKDKVATANKTYEKYKNLIGKASNELFAQFLIRICKEISGCVIATFSKLKILNASNFIKFRQEFDAHLEKLFIVPANTFDNVKGQFPIGFFIWNTELVSSGQCSVDRKRNGNTNHCSLTTNHYYSADIFDKDGKFLGVKKIFQLDNDRNIGKWIAGFKDKDKSHQVLGMLNSGRVDFQNQKLVYIANNVNDKAHSLTLTLTNIIPVVVFFAVRHCIEATWLNDRDQFLFPNDGWKSDFEFQSNCLAFALFHGQNRITGRRGEGTGNRVTECSLTPNPSSLAPNHWIPFTEDEVGSKRGFKSHFMTDFIAGKIKCEGEGGLFGQKSESKKIVFSAEAKALFAAWQELWCYYILQKDSDENASCYDIKAYFKGFNDKGRMNQNIDKSSPHYAKYTACQKQIKAAETNLKKAIEPKIYEYGFLW